MIAKSKKKKNTKYYGFMNFREMKWDFISNDLGHHLSNAELRRHIELLDSHHNSRTQMNSCHKGKIFFLFNKLYLKILPTKSLVHKGPINII